MDTTDKELLTVKDVGALLGLSRATIHRMRARGEFPEPIRVGVQSIRWPRANVQAFLESRKGETVTVSSA